MSQIGRFFASGGLVATLTGNAGGAISPDGTGNINILGSGAITVTGAGTTLTIGGGGLIATSYLTDDANSAVPAANVLTVAGGTNIGTTSAGSTATINLDGTITLAQVNATTFDTNIATAGVSLAGTSLVADGTDADIDINITAKGTGQVIIDDLQLTTPLTVPYGGTGVTTLTDHGLILGSGAGVVTSLAEATDGQIPIGSTGNDCVLANITSAGTTIDITDGAGSISLDLDSNVHTTAVSSMNGAILEEIAITAVSDGTDITFSIEKSGTGDLTVVFSDGFYAWDTSPAETVALTEGSDIAPQINYVYLLQSTKVLTVSIAGWPAEEHSKLARVLCQSAASMDPDGAYIIDESNNDVVDSDDMGHIIHINDWIRLQPATWVSGVDPTLTITPQGAAADDVIFTCGAGVVLHLHNHTFPAFVGTPDMYVVNDSGFLYNKIDDMNVLLTDSGAGDMSGKKFSLVVWGVQNANTGDCNLMVNLPSGSYTNNAALLADASRYTDYSIPSDFVGTGFLIAQYNLSHSVAASGTWTLVSEVNLRGLQPSVSAGGATPCGTEFNDNVFRILDEGDTTKELAFSVGGITTATTRTITMDDRNIDLDAVPDQVDTDAGSATPAAGILTIAGGTNLNSAGAGSTATVNLDDSITLAGSLDATTTVTAGTGLTVTANDIDISSGSLNLPTTTSTVGQIVINAERVLHTYGNNTFIGRLAGNFTTTGAANFAFGGVSMPALTSGDGNASIGNATFQLLTSGSQNTAVGTIAGWQLDTGSGNVLIGPTTNAPTYTTGTGTAYTGAESYNLLINNLGVLGESNKIRIGTQGAGAYQQDACYIAGIYGVTPVGTLNVAYVDSNGQLGSVASLGVASGGTGVATLTDHGVLLGSGAGAITATAVGATGEVIIGNTGADPSWLAAGTDTYVLTAKGAGVLPAWEANSAINTTYHTDGGDATESGDAITIAGGTNITTAGAAATATINLDAAITLTTVNATTFDTNVAAAGVTLAGTSLLADGTDANIDVNITAKGTGHVIIDDLQLTTDLAVAEGGTGASTLTDHGILVGSDTSAITPLAVGATGETLMGSTGADPAWTGSPSFSGSVTAATGLTVTANDVVITAGNLTLPDTTNTPTGTIEFGGTPYIHNYGNGANNGNIFFGHSSGNFTLTTATAIGNVAIGHKTMFSLTTGIYNTAIGWQSLNALTSGDRNAACSFNSLSLLQSGDRNTAFGNNCLVNLTTGSNNIGLGASAGASNGAGDAYTGAESNNIVIGSGGVLGESNKIRIGVAGSGAYQQDACYIAGIYNVAPTGGTDGAVIIDSNGQLGSTLTPTLTTVNATTFDTNVAAAAVTLVGTTLAADGTDANIDITITPKGTGTIKSLPVYGKSIGGTNSSVLVDDTGLFGTTTSSRRFKENIIDMGVYSSPLLSLRPVVFNFKNDPSKRRQYGLIAEEVIEYMPDLVNLDAEGLPHNVKYHDLPQLLLNEVKRQSKIISKLEDRLDILENMLKDKVL